MIASVLVTAPVVGLAAGLAGFTGFGVSLLAVPLLALTIGPHDAVVTGVVVSTAVSGVLVALERRAVDVRLITSLSLASVPGIVLGAVVFRALPEFGLRLLVAAIAIVSGLVVWRPERAATAGAGRLDGPGLLLATGLMSGAFSSSTGMGGPPVVSYLAVTRTQPSAVRANVSAYVLVAGTASAVMLALAGGVGSADFGQGLATLPAAGLGVLAGIAAFNRWPCHHAVVSALSLVAVGLMAATLALNSILGDLV